MNTFKRAICLISSFVLTISLGILIANNIVENKLLNKKYIESKLEESEFHEQISREVKSAFEEYIYQSGLPKDTIEGLFTDAMIKRDVSSLVNCVYEGSKITVSEAKKLFEDGTISGGMIPKIECCLEAIEKGVKKVFIMDGRVPHSLLIETLTDEGAGTMVKGDKEDAENAK